MFWHFLDNKSIVHFNEKKSWCFDRRQWRIKLELFWGESSWSQISRYSLIHQRSWGSMNYVQLVLHILQVLGWGYILGPKCPPSHTHTHTHTHRGSGEVRGLLVMLFVDCGAHHQVHFQKKQTLINSDLVVNTVEARAFWSLAAVERLPAHCSTEWPHEDQFNMYVLCLFQ